MIKAIFGGGLGNQMFQYAYIYSRLNDIDKKSVKVIMHRNINEDHREFSLNNYRCSIKFEIMDEKNAERKYSKYLFVRRLLCYIMKKFRFTSLKKAVILSKFGIIFSPEIYEYYPDLIIKKDSYIEGAFQNWRYFEAIKDELKQEFIPKTSLSKECKELIEMMKISNSVCVHIRRGDYLNSYYASTLAVCDNKYYNAAINLIEEQVANPEFFVFTNTHEDHVWIKNNYKFKGNVHYVDLNNPDYIELFMMSNCKHFIISNSTFSWWAQYLSSYDNKLVVAPSIWYRGNRTATEIYMPDWKIIDVE